MVLPSPPLSLSQDGDHFINASSRGAEYNTYNICVWCGQKWDCSTTQTRTGMTMDT